MGGLGAVHGYCGCSAKMYGTRWVSCALLLRIAWWVWLAALPGPRGRRLHYVGKE